MTLSRERLCLSCRTALMAGEPCDVCGADDVIAFAEPDGRAAAARAIWTTVEVERPWVFRGAVTSFALLLVGIIAGTIWAVKAGEGGLGALFLFGGPVLLCVALIVPAFFHHTAARRPIGATLGLRPPADLERVPGTVVADGQEPVAEQLELTLGDGAVTLRDGRTRGFVVALGDGRRIELPAGRVRVEAPTRDVGPKGVEGWLRELDPDRATAELRPFPYQRARIAVVRPGQEVEVIVALARDERGYRDGAPPRVVGVPWIRRT